ncbi:MAG: ABC transporter substrate-binding protein [Gammaproteobacteria bacterium]
MTLHVRPRHIATFACAALLCLSAQADRAAEPQPIDVLRAQVAAGIELLDHPDYDDPTRQAEQRERLCDIANEMFDVHAFSRLVLMSGWKSMSSAEQEEFVTVFGDFLCRYYLSRLQMYYADEQLKFASQEFRSDTQARVSASVVWRGTEIPFEVRMVYREGRWRAFDIAVSGISAVLIYRAQFQPVLFKESPRALIEDLRQRIAEEG